MSAQVPKEDPGPQMGLVLGGGLPSIPADLLQRIQKKQYVELMEFLPERIQESFLFPDGKKRKLQPIDKFLDWVLAFCTYSQALAASSPHLAADLLRCLSSFSAYYQFSYEAIHIPGACNTLADDISRNRTSSLSSQVPSIHACPTVVPPALWSLLVVETPDWTSSRWRALFRDFMLMV